MTSQTYIEKSKASLGRGKLLGLLGSLAYSLLAIAMLMQEERNFKLNEFYQKNPDVFFGEELPKNLEVGIDPSIDQERQEEALEKLREALLNDPNTSALEIITGQKLRRPLPTDWGTRY